MKTLMKHLGATLLVVGMTLGAMFASTQQNKAAYYNNHYSYYQTYINYYDIFQNPDRRGEALE
jgi:hypothetical protein